MNVDGTTIVFLIVAWAVIGFVAGYVTGAGYADPRN